MTPNDTTQDESVIADETFRKVHSGRYSDNPETNTPETTTSPAAKGPSRKVDVFAGKQSLADKLRQRRKAVEGGDATGGQGDY
jgi:hypothetical protein